MQWVDEATGLDCLIVRNSLKALCGYVGVPPGHPLYGVDYMEEDAAYLRVHGGLTYAGACQGHICHVPEKGRPEHVWWLGFDCGHWQDFVPGMKDYPGFKSGGTYRTIDYVREECAKLAKQIKEGEQP